MKPAVLRDYAALLKDVKTRVRAAQVRAFVVVDLKKGPFKLEYAGKMNFYCSATQPSA